jgi:hypothetical protein
MLGTQYFLLTLIVSQLLTWLIMIEAKLFLFGSTTDTICIMHQLQQVMIVILKNVMH